MPLNEYPLEEPIETGISTSRIFIELQALRAWGVGLDGLRQWKEGKIGKDLLDLIYHWYVADQLYANHRNDAVSIEQQNRAKRAQKS